MKFNYSVTQEDYADMLVSLFRIRDRKPFRLAVLFMLTVGQTVWAIWYCLTHVLSEKELAFIVCWSVLLSTINLLPRVLRGRRAKQAVTNLVSSGQLLPDFWKPHTLTFRKGEVQVRYGSVNLSCPTDSLTTELVNGFLLLYSCGKIFDMVPAGQETLQLRIRAALAESLQTEQENAPQPPEDPEEALHFQMSGLDYLKLQVRVYQQYFVTQTFLKPIFLLKTAVTAYLVYYVLSRPFNVYSALCLGCGFVLIMPAFLIITPLVRRQLLSKFPELRGLSENPVHISCYIQGNELTVIHNGVRQQVYDLRKMLFISNTPFGILLFDNNWPAPAIPRSAFSGREEQAYVHLVLKNRS